ncbi:probable pectinesterase/pectinesterase inhibitor 32 isoform X2 [Momordica charantia]|uniref:Probable pectinesterase/pectinesterase inhibitor 32 isoform X2 n=1 Tax=Momordica charantia TaxID=3673 RepID=A0A6J1DSX3_MOMCH|nr:probable pectinesterase/pectinesterase inhibitor 32 isoform X2 [Momordica charantia]
MDLVTYKSISDGIAAPDNGDTRFYIRVTSRIYHEHIEILYAKKFIALIGDNISTTIIVDNQSTGFGTAETATLSQNNGFSQNCSLMASPELGPREDHHNFDIYLA